MQIGPDVRLLDIPFNLARTHICLKDNLQQNELSLSIAEILLKHHPTEKYENLKFPRDLIGNKKKAKNNNFQLSGTRRIIYYIFLEIWPTNTES